jgi:hypothetical protein
VIGEGPNRILREDASGRRARATGGHPLRAADDDERPLAVGIEFLQDSMAEVAAYIISAESSVDPSAESCRITPFILPVR